ncbi:MAG: asparagine synthase (glutamine-hydrolyzing) [Verrucomicrobiota bacterium]
MCGIAGIINVARAQPVEPEMLHAMMRSLVHRGPDDSGEYRRGNVGFGFRRLSIIDVAGGHQPLANEDDSIWIVFNGEIYNFPELFQELRARGHVFKTRSDTEAIVHAYEEWGPECVQHLRGMFAFAIHDQHQDLIFAARDRFGIKPFYYAFDGRTFLFASELKPILTTGLVPARLDPETVESFVSIGYVPGPRTLVAGIQHLQPAHTLLFQGGHLRVQRYWDYNQATASQATEADLLRQLDEKLRESIKMHLLSDVPLGVFLSGGLDSSSIVALMRDAGCDKIRTFSVGYADAPAISELEYARQIATHYQTDHQEFILKSGNFMQSLADMTNQFGEPIVEAPGIALYQIAKAAKSTVTVALSGEGADEIFAGYGLYDTFAKFQRDRHYWRALLPFVNRLRPRIRSEKIRKYLDWFTTDIPLAYRGTSYDVTSSIRQDLFNGDFINRQGTYLAETFHDHFRRVTYNNTLNQLTYVDAQTWLVDDILAKSDRMTMAASIECRVPFLDHELVEFAATLPNNLKIRRGIGKYGFKKIMEPRLPRNIIYRKKVGFAIPLRQWFQRDLFAAVEGMLTSTRFRQRGYFNPAYVDRVLCDHKAGRTDYSRRLLTFYMFELWHQSFLDVPPTPRASPISVGA